VLLRAECRWYRQRSLPFLGTNRSYANGDAFLVRKSQKCDNRAEQDWDVVDIQAEHSYGLFCQDTDDEPGR
jgi:hypothetical protein